MFSGFDPFINRLNRIVEQTDTRQEIRRDDIKVLTKDSEEQKERKPQWSEEDDSMEVSIDAVIALLQGSLAEARPAEEETLPQQAPMNVKTNNAARAYQNTARFSHDDEPPPATTETPSMAALTTDEEKRIARFLIELQKLKQDGIFTLTILRSGSFFDSLDMAIRYARLQ
ncbi:MAG: hypothetical protein GC136_08245 [Alphaproteobacteria bacterium]|nr:hypothetical protein [Alphaproteobacteria bacterium]